MKRFELYIHGVPIGHDVCGSENDLEYINSFYNHDENASVKDILQIDVLNRKAFYTYLHKKDVRNAEGRPGSYCALTISFNGEYCTNVKMLFDILDAIYKQICTGCLITSDSHGELFLVKKISSCMYKGRTLLESVEAIINNNIDSLFFKKIEGDYIKTSNTDYSLQEVDSPAFYEAMKRGRISVSPEYTSSITKLSQLISKQEPLIQQNATLKREKQTLSQQNSKLAEEVKSLRKQLSESTASFKHRYDKEIQELKEKLKDSNDTKNALAEKISKVSDEIDLIEVPFQKLSRLLARRFRDDSNVGREKVRQPDTEVCSTDRKYLWFQSAVIILLLCASAFSVYAFYSLHNNVTETINLLKSTPVTDNVNSNQAGSQSGNFAGGNIGMDAAESNDKVDVATDNSNTVLATDEIDIKEFPDSNSYAQKGKTYTLRIRRGSGQAAYYIQNLNGVWQCDTGNPAMSIITIIGNSFKVGEHAESGTNVLIQYVVNNEVLISRPIKIK